jgi:hypothetical protein
VVKWTEEELLPPVITRDSTGKIIRVDVRGAPNFVVIKQHVERKLIPFDTARLKLGGEQKLIWRDGAVYEEQFYTVIDAAYPAPWLAHHLRLGQLMREHGKGPDAPKKS